VRIIWSPATVRAGRSHGGGERGDVVGAVVAAAVDEGNVGVPETPLRSALSTSLGNLGGTGVLAQIVAEAIDVESQLLGVAHEILGTEGVLVGEEKVVHLPEGALCRWRPDIGTCTPSRAPRGLTEHDSDDTRRAVADALQVLEGHLPAHLEYEENVAATARRLPDLPAI
jgi:hypothetical protein